jgi:hypothetical protein
MQSLTHTRSRLDADETRAHLEQALTALASNSGAKGFSDIIEP